MPWYHEKAKSLYVNSEEVINLRIDSKVLDPVSECKARILKTWWYKNKSEAKLCSNL